MKTIINSRTLAEIFANQPVNIQKPMKTNLTKTLNYSLAGAVCAGAFMLASNALAQNLFVSDLSANNIYEYTPGGAQSTFATGMNVPFGIAFNANGDLFVANCE